MKDIRLKKDQVQNDLYLDAFAVPEEPFGISKTYWITGLIVFTSLLILSTIFLLIKGGTPNLIGAFYAIPAILFAYFYRRKGVLLVYLLAMFFFTIVVIFRYPSADDIFGAAIRGILLIAIALTVSYLTHYLVQEKRKYHAIFENTENGVVLLNITDHRILEMNKRFALSVGLSESETKGRKLSDFINDPTPLATIFSMLQSQCSTPALEITMRKSDGTAWIAVMAARKISVDHMVITVIDFTERKKLEAVLHQLHHDATLYLDILTHDINNINTASLNYGRLLEIQNGDQSPDLVINLNRSLEKSDEIIRNISALRKIQECKVQCIPLPISSIITKEIEGFPYAKIEYDGSSATVLADEMLSSVFYNIIGNAIKFGGRDPRITIRVTEADKEVTVSVADTGPGIPDSLKPHIFERFQRGDTTVSGKGLGLYICKALIERYGGSIRVEDRVLNDIGKGAVIVFTLKKS
jgi:PAS domain S-box-containing protein